MSNENGYGKPPKKNQWQKGRSGNPKGRPRAAARSTAQPVDTHKIVTRISNRKVGVIEQGKKVSISRAEFLINKIYHDAVQGDAKARELYFKLIAEANLAALAGQGTEPLHIIITGGLPGD